MIISYVCLFAFIFANPSLEEENVLLKKTNSALKQALNELVSEEEATESETAVAGPIKICAVDNCKGTLTNGIPWGQQWIKVGDGASKGCCSFGMGACELCSPSTKVCATDACYGTLTNPIPWGKQWVSGGIANGFCCTFGTGACEYCAPPKSEIFAAEESEVSAAEEPETAVGLRTKVCAQDSCKGTVSNDVPVGSQWFSLGQASDKGCCRFGTGACEWCTPAEQVCSKDNCSGSWTNPIPSGQKWKSGGKASDTGCCWMGRGECEWCYHPEK